MPIIIRHGTKKWSNKSGKHDDPPLKKEAKKQIKSMVKKLIKLKKIPKMIYISPYTRCLQTCKIILKVLKKYNISVDVQIDQDLGEYISGTCPRIPKGRNINCKEESKKDIQKRIKTLKKRYLSETDIWIITHRPIIEKLTGEHVKEGKFLIF